MSSQEELNNALIQGVKEENLEKVNNALKNGAQVDTMFNTDWGWTVLFRSLYLGNVPIINALLQAGANVNHIDAQNENALFPAVRLGNLGVVKTIVESGTEINHVSDENLTPICFALIERNLPLTEYLISKGANINPFDPDQSVPFSLVIDNAELNEDLTPFVDIFLNAGLNINAKDHRGWTALMKTIKRGMNRAYRLLIEKGAEVNQQANDGNNAILEAACKEDPEFITYLISVEGNPNLSHASGFSPLMAASKFGNLEVAKLLTDAGASINAKDGMGLTPLMYASTSNAAIVKHFLDQGADKSLKSNENKIAQDYAQEFENQEAYNLLT